MSRLLIALSFSLGLAGGLAAALVAIGTLGRSGGEERDRMAVRAGSAGHEARVPPSGPVGLIDLTAAAAGLRESLASLPHGR
jgi:hypothetical protein